MMLAKIKQYIIDNHLPDVSNRIIIGISGGADSVAMLDILVRLGYSCIMAHCNFHLRGDESDRDADFVKSLSLRYNLPLHYIDFQTEIYAKENSISIEMAARELRYNWFEELRSANDNAYIAVAHHADDSVETVLLNLTRGTGIRGLTGIAAQNGFVIRPLLDVSRTDILNYLQSQNLSFVNDSSNCEDIYIRNKIRLKVIPLLQTINPSAKDAIIRAAENLSQVEKIYNHYIDNAKQIVLKGDKIDINKLQLQIEPKAVLYEILSVYGFNAATVDTIFGCLNNQSGKIFLSDQYRVVKDRNFLLIEKLTIDKSQEMIIRIDFGEKNHIQISNPLSLSITTIDNESSFSFERNSNIFYADYDKLTTPFYVRHWKQGDSFIPFGMKGRKKLSDYFSDNKFSLIDKENTWLLCTAENDIAWIIGHRSDNRYRVDKETKKIIVIEYNPE